MIRLRGPAVLVVLLPLFVSACSSHPPAPVRHAAITYACCRVGDLDRTYRPGDTLLLHWHAEVVPGGRSTTQPVVLTAALHGPFPTAVAAKRDSSRVVLRAAPLRIPERAGTAPVSSLVLPHDLAPGIYDLTTATSQNGNTVSGGTLLTVGPRSS